MQRSPRGRMSGSSSSSPSMRASSSSSTSTSNRCWPSCSPAAPAPSPSLASPASGSPLSPGPWPTPCLFSPKRRRGSSICGTGIETACSPRRPRSSLVERYLRRSPRRRPRTISRKRARSRSMRNMRWPRRSGGLLHLAAALGLAAREQARDVLEHLVGRDLVVPELAHQPVADDRDLLLRVGVDDGRDQARELDRVAPVLEGLELERAREARVLAVVEGAALEVHRRDVVHQLVAAVGPARLRDLHPLLDPVHQSLVPVALAPGRVDDLLARDPGLDVVDVLRAQAVDGLAVGDDRQLDLALDDLLVLLARAGHELHVALARLPVRDQRA